MQIFASIVYFQNSQFLVTFIVFFLSDISLITLKWGVVLHLKKEIIYSFYIK